MNPQLGERLLAWLLARVNRITYGVLGGGFGLLWVCLSLSKALLVAALLVLGYLIGKWLDEGRPDGGLSRRLRRLLDGEED